MRVISGIYRGRKLKAPKGSKTRPTSDRVKEAVFNTLGPVLENCHSFLDLFAGSGAIGIEALSRGIEKCVFVENWSGAIKALQDNLQVCSSHHDITILPIDAEIAFKKLHNNNFQIIFMDPPYKMSNVENLINVWSRLLDKNGLLVLETSVKNDFPSSLNELTCLKLSRYGDTKVLYYKKNAYEEG